MTIRGVVEDDVDATLGSLADEEAGIAEIETANGHVDTDFSMVFPFELLELGMCWGYRLTNGQGRSDHH